MNFELLLLIFIFILLGVIVLDYRKKKLIINAKSDEERLNSDTKVKAKKSNENNRSHNNSSRNNETSQSDNSKDSRPLPKDEFVSKPRVVSNNTNNSNASFSDSFETTKGNSNPEKIICLYVKSNNEKLFLGNDLLRVLLSLGCRFGDMKIFHRHEHKNGIGKELFSVASMLEPGNFDLTKLPESKIPGVVLFFSTSKVSNPLETYHLMLDSAKKISQYLGGDLLDGQRNILTPENITRMSELLASYSDNAQERVI